MYLNGEHKTRLHMEGWAANFSSAWDCVLNNLDCAVNVTVVGDPGIDAHALDLATTNCVQVHRDLSDVPDRADLILVDCDADPEHSLAFCRAVKNDSKTELIPVLLTSERSDLEWQLEVFRAGADVWLRKPVHPEILRSRVQALLRHKRATDRLERTETILFALAQAVELRDNATGGHCERLAIFSLALGMTMGLSHDELLVLYRGGFLHDIGKVAMPDSVLLKPGKLDDQEWRVMKTHTTRGEEICRPLKSLAPVLPIIRHHHERWDGSGYPDGITGQEIPVLARVMQLADIYDALTSKRPYKTALSPREALAIMEQEADFGWRDPELMSLFLNLSRSALGNAASYIHEHCRDVNRQDLLSLHDALKNHHCVEAAPRVTLG